VRFAGTSESHLRRDEGMVPNGPQVKTITNHFELSEHASLPNFFLNACSTATTSLRDNERDRVCKIKY